MFENLSEKLGNVFSKLRGKSTLTASDIEFGLKEIRIALLEADVSVDVVKKFFEKIKTEALGEKVLKNIAPEHMIVEIVYKNILQILSEKKDIEIPYDKQLRIMLVGLQGAGKTTTVAKIAEYFSKKIKKENMLLASCDVSRPAAVQQLRILSQDIGVDFFEIDENKENAVEIATRLSKSINNKDFIVLDTAGRLYTDEDLMNELISVKKEFDPNYVFLVADSMTGQDAINIALDFNNKIGISGVILTKMDGNSRCGAALSMKIATGCPIFFVGTGEKINQLELFDSEKIAKSILGMGDIVSLVEKAREVSNTADDENLAKRIQSGKFDLNDFAAQFKKINSMGGVMSVLKYLPGASAIQNAVQKNGFDKALITKNLAMIASMTKLERKNPDIIKSSRKKRITEGSGTTIQDLNKLLTQYNQMKDVMKKLQKMSAGNMFSMFKNFMK